MLIIVGHSLATYLPVQVLLGEHFVSLLTGNLENPDSKYNESSHNIIVR